MPPQLFQHTFGVHHHFLIRESHDRHPLRSEVRGSSSVVRLALDREMLPPIQLQRQPANGAVEVDDVGSDRVLTAKFQVPKLPHTQQPPKQSLGVGALSPQQTSSRKGGVHEQFSDATEAKLRRGP
jgi:hypothetical protein